MASCVQMFSTHLIISPKTWEPTQVQNLLASHGILDIISDERSLGELGDKGTFLVSSKLSHYVDNALFEMHLTSLFPGWDRYSPRKKFDLVFNQVHVWEANRMRRLIRRQGRISVDDIRIWREDGLSLWHWICFCFGSWDDRFLFVRKDDEDWKELLFETITLVDDLHQEHPVPWFQFWDRRASWDLCMSGIPLTPEDSYTFTPFSCIFVAFITFGGCRALERTVSSYLSVLERCGVDVREFGRREFDIWERSYGAIHKKDTQYVAIGHWDWKIGGDILTDHPRWAAAQLMGIYYGSKTWSFDWDRSQIHASEDFWRMVENPRGANSMPGAWFDDDGE